MSAISLTLSVSVLQADEPKNFSAATEIELTNRSPSVKSVAVKLKGTEREKEALDTLGSLVQDILSHAKLGVVKLPKADNFSPISVKGTAQKLEIVIDVKAAFEVGQPYKVSLTLQEAGSQGMPAFFDYSANAQDKIRQQLEEYLTERLDLQPIRESFTKKVEVPPQTVLPFQSVKKLQPILPSLVEERQQSVPQHISSGTEVQLKNLSPSVKSISIKLQGTQREQKVLDNVQSMVKDILNASKLGVVRIPIAAEPMTTPVIKVYEYLEIVIGAKSPDEAEQPYQVSITLQEKGGQGEPRLFDYKADDWWYFFKDLKAYLTEQLNLKPK
ncbi:MAG: hypothetical protein DRQ49_00910 [Gammaproteobacteria bacterium]|nr:MAG: hypothetical protein DRQ49_00910 [Gammaproteobacteria bacterium]RKZ45236.1 MAG: hypothetical protein DRQ41_00770 [Gammaproteobacteria bacterium]RKZ77198.1 MAG: hypothetical protein DRQ57_01100 [Gammaproteobacteria bacterium]